MVTKKDFEKIKKEKPESRIGQRSREEQEVRNDLARVLVEQRKVDRLKKEREKELSTIGEFSEKYCLEKLSIFLSRDELKIIKNGINDYEFSDMCRFAKFLNKEMDDLSLNEKVLAKIKKMKEGFNYRKWEILSDKLISRLKGLDEEEKLLCAYYLARQGIIICGRDSLDDSFDFGFYYTDMDSERCDMTIKTLKDLGLDKYVRYVGDSCYRIDKQGLQAIVDKKQKDSISGIKEEIDKLNKEHGELDIKRQELEQKKEEFETKREALKKYGEPIEKALDILLWERGINRQKDIKFDKQYNTCVVLSEYSHNSGSAGMEYGVIISVKRGSNTKQLSIKYRDPYDSSKDDWSKCYNNIDDVRVEGDKVFVTVSSSKSTQTYKFDISEGVDGVELLDKKAQKAFKARVEQEVQRLLQENTKDLTYPNTYDFGLREMPGGLSEYEDLKYDKAKVINEHIDLLKGVAYIEIKAQTDASGVSGKEYAIIKYEITSSETKEVDRKYARQRS